jgi:hypothetical protein
MKSKKLFQSFGRLTITLALIALTQGCAGMGEGWPTPQSEGLSYLREELMWHFYDTLRPPRQEAAWLRRANPDGGPYRDNKGEIPMALIAPEVNGEELCVVMGDTHCGSIAFGDELIQRPELRSAISEWIRNFCTRFPTGITNENRPRYFASSDRASHAAYLRKFMGCESPGANHRVSIHIYAISDFDQVFHGSSAGTSMKLKKAVVGEWIIDVNK